MLEKETITGEELKALAASLEWLTRARPFHTACLTVSCEMAVVVAQERANNLPFLETRETLNQMVPHTYHALRSRLRIALAFNAIIIPREFVGGFLTNSIGLIGDAGHNLVDQGSLFLALYAHVLTARPATDTRTFGYHRAGIVAAFLNSFILILTAVGITLVSVERS